ncbi:hypothetical protein ABZW18_34460 [Streptomyces sp. NPDC004647]|uniref:hypothetical protein n=1 Tax=Streptomyces sp. NPDC004647 TaxID=3154671 RepID=UPI0033BE3BE0
MSPDIDSQRTDTAGSGRSELTIAGGLMVVGLLLNVVMTAIHPAGEENDHPAIFTEYADSGAWVAIHLGQFVGVLLALAGLLVLYRAMRAAGRPPLPAHLAAAATVATAATWAVLQGLDGVGLKQAVEAWDSASGAEKPIRFANAETVRWLEWGIQSYFRILLGLTFALFGAAILASRLVVGWLGWAAVLAGLFSVAIGVDVGYNGLASGLQDALGIAFLVVVLAFAFGVLATGRRARDQHPA